MLAPIVLFVYNRPSHTAETLRKLAENPLAQKSNLIVFADAHKNYAEEMKVAHTRDECYKVRDRFKSFSFLYAGKHLGLKESIIQGMEYIFNNYDRAIVLEDDILVSKDFLQFMNDGLEFHKNNPNVFSITANCPPIDTSTLKADTFLYPRFWCQAWGTWKDRWKIDWHPKNPERFTRGGNDQNAMLKKAMLGKLQSWAIYVCYASRNKYTVFPRVSKTENIGWDNTGTNSRTQKKWLTKINEEHLRYGFTVEYPYITEQIEALSEPSPIRKIINFIQYGVRP